MAGKPIPCQRQPGALAHGSSGVGGIGHLAGALFQSMTATQLLHVPYKGGAPGFVRVVDSKTIAFPSYDGNGMFLTIGNVTNGLATISGAAISLNNSSNFATNINTGTSTGTVTIGKSLTTSADNGAIIEYIPKNL